MTGNTRFDGQDGPAGAETYSAAMSEATNYIAWILSAFTEILRPPILEIGIGHASYATLLRARGEYIGVDIDERSVAAARSRFPESDFHVADITRSVFVDAIGKDRIGSVICLNVLEHIDDHQSAVASLAQVLRPGGHLAVIVPALRLLTNDLDRLAGHLRRYRTDELGRLARVAGLEVIRADYFNPVGGFGWLANRLVRHRSLNDAAVNGQIRLFDKWAIPVSKAMDPLTRRFFGQSVLMIGRKP
jgi:SAM-dependent methyltransferase